jgi:ABC-type nitrate/sulfonate/bicarbonate transport system ATPase subunit
MPFCPANCLIIRSFKTGKVFMGNSVLSVSGLSKSYPDTGAVLSNISLHVDSKEFVSIIGPSGCGKSTFFSVLSGIDTQYSGSINLKGLHQGQSRLGQFGYMFQEPLLLPWRTVEENIMLGLNVAGVPKTAARKKAHNQLVKFGLERYAKLYPSLLSGGIAQRIALLRTILFNHTFLLLDEPFGALDALTRRSCQMWLTQLLSEFSSCVLFITHDIREAILLSDRIYVFSKKPASVMKEVKVNLTRPRKRGQLTQKEAIQLEKEVEDLLL